MPARGMRARYPSIKNLVRCTRCNRLTDVSQTTKFNGGVYGPDCIGKAMAAALDDPFAESKEQEQE